MSKRSKKPTAGRKKVRRRILPWRVALVFSPLVGLLLAVAWFWWPWPSLLPGTVDVSPALTEALEAGRRDARRVLDTGAGTMERDRALFEIHARASALRLDGFDDEADEYLRGARKVLSEQGVID